MDFNSEIPISKKRRAPCQEQEKSKQKSTLISQFSHITLGELIIAFAENHDIDSVVKMLKEQKCKPEQASSTWNSSDMKPKANSSNDKNEFQSWKRNDDRDRSYQNKDARNENGGTFDKQRTFSDRNSFNNDRRGGNDRGDRGNDRGGDRGRGGNGRERTFGDRNAANGTRSFGNGGGDRFQNGGDRKSAYIQKGNNNQKSPEPESNNDWNAASSWNVAPAEAPKTETSWFDGKFL